jgi:hypothetical protein
MLGVPACGWLLPVAACSLDCLRLATGLPPVTTCLPCLPVLAAVPALPVQVSHTVLRRCMRCLPGLRDKMTGAFAAFVVRIQEDYPEVVKDSLALLLRWAGAWLSC